MSLNCDCNRNSSKFTKITKLPVLVLVGHIQFWWTLENIVCPKDWTILAQNQKRKTRVKTWGWCQTEVPIFSMLAHVCLVDQTGISRDTFRYLSTKSTAKNCQSFCHSSTFSLSINTALHWLISCASENTQIQIFYSIRHEFTCTHNIARSHFYIAFEYSSLSYKHRTCLKGIDCLLNSRIIFKSYLNSWSIKKN